MSETRLDGRAEAVTVGMGGWGTVEGKDATKEAVGELRRPPWVAGR